MDLSIIIPVYNTPPDVLISSLNTVILTDDIQWEAIIVDDGSKEDTAVVCRQYVETRQRFCYIRQENQGVSNARNTGIEQASGKYIMFVDADDRFISKAFSRRFLELDKDVVFFPFWIHDGERKIVRSMFQSKANENVTKEEALLQACRNRLNAVFAKLFRRSMVEANRIRFNESMVNGEDAMFVLDAIIASKTLYYADVCIYDYIYSQDSGIGRIRKYPNKIFENALHTYQVRERTLRQMQVPGAEKTQIAVKEQLVMDWFGVLCNHPRKGTSQDELWKLAQNHLREIPRSDTKQMSAQAQLKYIILRYGLRSAGAVYNLLKNRFTRQKIK